MKRELIAWALAICAVAAPLRFVRLDSRPMHADEAILADKLGTFLEKGAYQYDPSDYHGPVLLWVGSLAARLSGEADYRSLTEPVIRATPAIAGVLLALTPLVLFETMGVIAAGLAGLLIAASPACVYYSRYFIPETLLALFTALVLVCVHRKWWIAAGVCAALAVATKETAVIALAALAIAGLAVLKPRRIPIGLVAGFAIIVLLVPPVDFVRAMQGYWVRGTGASIHSHPFFYYVEFLALEPVTLVVASVMLLLRGNKLLRMYVVLLSLAYSCLSYKTPWCVVSIVYGFALLAGLGIHRLYRWHRLGGVSVAVLGCAQLIWFSYRGAIQQPATSAWAYAQTGTGVYEVVNALGPYSAEPLGVYSTQNIWPLPWYLRAHKDVRWYRGVPAEGMAEPVILATPELESSLQIKFYESPPPGQRELYMNLLRKPTDLRPGVEIRGFVRKTEWDRGTIP